MLPPPALDAKMIAQAIQGARGSWENGKGERAQLCLPHISADCATALYIIPQARTVVATVFANTLKITPHCLHDFFRF